MSNFEVPFDAPIEPENFTPNSDLDFISEDGGVADQIPVDDFSVAPDWESSAPAEYIDPAIEIPAISEDISPSAFDHAEIDDLHIEPDEIQMDTPEDFPLPQMEDNGTWKEPELESPLPDLSADESHYEVPVVEGTDIPLPEDEDTAYTLPADSTVDVPENPPEDLPVDFPDTDAVPGRVAQDDYWAEKPDPSGYNRRDNDWDIQGDDSTVVVPDPSLYDRRDVDLENDQQSETTNANFEQSTVDLESGEEEALVITPEYEQYPQQEKILEIEPGSSIKPSWDDSPSESVESQDIREATLTDQADLGTGEPDLETEDEKETPSYENPAHEKGAILEVAHAEIIMEGEDNVLLPSHDSVTTPGFDNVYYDQDHGMLVVTEEKNYGSEDNERYVSDISAWDGDRFETNAEDILDRIDRSDAPEHVKESMRDAYYNDQIERELVVGPYTRVSNDKLEEYGVDRLIRVDPETKTVIDMQEMEEV
jgi:hypothetical protein